MKSVPLRGLTTALYTVQHITSVHIYLVPGIYRRIRVNQAAYPSRTDVLFFVPGMYVAISFQEAFFYRVFTTAGDCCMLL